MNEESCGGLRSKSVWLRNADNCSHAALIILLLTALVGIWLIGIPSLSTSASSDGIITVCPAGPPECDYQTIQEAINAAGTGDTVLVYPGTYIGQVTLKSDVSLESSDGPEVTTITATEGPIVTASDVVSAAVQGFSISGQDIITATVGIELFDSDLVLSDCIIRDLRGADGQAAEPDGEDAIAIRSTGFGTLTIMDSTIQDITGGDGLKGVDGGATGGDALGIWADGGGEAIITRTIIRRLTGGAAGTYVDWPYGCDGTGGPAVGIRTEGGVDLVVSSSEVTELVGGQPCSALAEYCVYRAGAAIGIQATGGMVFVRDSLFTSFSSRAAHYSEPIYAIHTSLTSGTHLERNTIASLSAGGAGTELRALWPESPFCIPPPRTVIAVASAGDALLRVTDNSVTDLLGVGRGGQAVGVLAQDVGNVALARNSIAGIKGGSSRACSSLRLTAVGFWVERADTAEISANVLGGIRGGSTPLVYYGYGDDGGSATGIKLTVVTDTTVVNNSVWSLTGGRGSGRGDHWYPRYYDGGDATALDVARGSASIRNNTFCQTVAGVGGYGGEPGAAVGLRLAEGADVLAVNNALISHGIGISSTCLNAPSLGYNDLWDNETDYEGVAPGANDLHVDPAFVDAENGDFHLSPDSPLIDVGTNVDSPSEDFEGEPRPVDGDNDNIPIADVGADEYWPGLRGSTKTVDQLIAAPGDHLSYQLTLVNPNNWHDLPGVTLTDTIPTETMYVERTLWGTTGTWGYADNVITWTGTVSAGEMVTLTFDVTIDEELVGPHAIVNQAVLDDRVGVTRTIRAVTLVNPLRCYFPLVLVSSP